MPKRDRDDPNNSAKSKISIYCQNIPIGKVRPEGLSVCRRTGDGPAIRWSVTSAREGTDQGLDVPGS